MELPGNGWVAPSTPKETTPLRGPALPAFPRDGRLNVSSNIILHFRVQELKDLCFVNFVLALLTLLYMGVNVTMFVLNYLNRDDDDCGDPDSVYVARCGSPVSAFVFHALEFWATAAYAMVEAFALVYTPRALSSISNRPNLLKLLLFFDVVATFVPALLVTLNLEAFEVASHEIEYCNELTMAFANLVLLASLVRRRRGAEPGQSAGGDGAVNASIALAAAATAAVQVLVYNSGLPDAERVAHYFEFTFAVLSSFVTFWFCLDNRAMGEEEVLCIMYGDHRDCSNCNVVHTSRASELVALKQAGSLNAAARARRHPDGAACLV